MKALKFTLSGKTAFFKKPDVNTYFYFTYGNIHKVALLGILGAVLGLKGYNEQNKGVFPEFYERLKDIKVAVVPINNEGYISKKIQVYNNSVGYASKEEGGNLIIKEQWLENPKWSIYVLLKDEISEALQEKFVNSSFTYVPYLGRNDHFADIRNVEIVDLEEINSFKKIHSLYIKEYFDIGQNDDFEEEWKYEEKLPLKLEEETNQYILETFVFTNINVKQKEACTLFKDEEKVIFFF